MNRGIFWSIIVVIALLVATLVVYLAWRGYEDEELRKSPPNVEEESASPERDDQQVQRPEPAPQRSVSMRFDSAVAVADSLFKQKAYTRARRAYLRSLEIMEDPYPYDQIRAIKRLAEEQAREKQPVKQKKRDKKVFVEGGPFEMRLQLRSDSLISRRITVNSFYISRYEVTVAEYRNFCNATGKDMPKEPDWGWQDDMPVVNVSWQDAKAYAEWDGKRLPTNAEWHYAALGGQQSNNYTYSGSNTLNEVGWFWQNADKITHPVGSKQPNELGIYDMTGNVWEWCSDWYDENYLMEGPVANPRGPEEGSKKILRGGSWYSYRDYCALKYLSNGEKDYKYVHIGFRLAWDADK